MSDFEATDCESGCRGEAEIVNATGLHARPCHAIAALAGEFESSLRVGCRDRESMDVAFWRL